MAFTEVEVAEAHAAIEAGPSGDELNKLGLIYSTGDGPTLDYVEAHKWFNLAAFKGCQSAKNYRAELASEMSAEEIAEAQRAARQWLHGNA